MTKVQEQCTALIVHGGGPLGRRARDQIEYDMCYGSGEVEEDGDE